MLCENKDRCPFYQKKNPVHDEMYKVNVERFCESSYDRCALFQVIEMKGEGAVPADLYPNQINRLNDILA
jgi:hypothetical protein